MGISVLTPSFGYGRYIGDTICSVLYQECDALQDLIVMDGASSDETVEVLESFSHDARLVWRSEADAGQSDALNKALELASGDWVGWLNADEFYLPGALASVALAIERNPEVDVIYGDFVEVDAQGRMTRVVAEHQFSLPALRRGCYIPSCATFFRRASLPSRGWDVNCVSMMDWDLFLEIAGAGGRFLHLPEPLAAFRIHGEQVTKSASAQSTEEFSRIRSRHHIPTSGIRLQFTQARGRLAHVGRKVVESGYRREAQGMRVRGQELRWFDGSHQSSREWPLR